MEGLTFFLGKVELVNQSVLTVECDPVVGRRVGLVGGSYGVVDLPSEVRFFDPVQMCEVLTELVLGGTSDSAGFEELEYQKRPVSRYPVTDRGRHANSSSGGYLR